MNSEPQTQGSGSSSIASGAESGTATSSAGSGSGVAAFFPFPLPLFFPLPLPLPLPFLAILAQTKSSSADLLAHQPLRTSDVDVWPPQLERPAAAGGAAVAVLHAVAAQPLLRYGGRTGG